VTEVIFYSPVAIPATQPTVSKQGCCPRVLAHSNYIHFVEWQVTLCDPIWHVSSSSGVATSVSELLYPCYFALCVSGGKTGIRPRSSTPT